MNTNIPTAETIIGDFNCIIGYTYTKELDNGTYLEVDFCDFDFDNDIEFFTNEIEMLKEYIKYGKNLKQAKSYARKIIKNATKNNLIIN